MSVERKVEANASSIFFFQAEDGIRDGHVTGVQTCCSSDLGVHPATTARAVFLGKKYPFYVIGPDAQRALIGIPLGTDPGISPLRIETKAGAAARYATQRSEERRVGKECRSRG